MSDDEQQERRLARIRAIYDRSAERYERCMGLTDRLTRSARRRVGESAEGAVLEVGIGTGLSLPWYGPRVTSVTGVELSPGMLARCRERATACRFRVDLVEHDAQRLPFESRSFDSVVFSLCLCTIPDPERAIREAIRVARPGARMLFLEHVRSNLPVIGLLQDVVTPLTLWLEADHFNRRTEDTARRCGVEVERVRRWALGVLTLIEGRAPAP